MSSSETQKIENSTSVRRGARDVRQELIDAALVILSTDGLEALTLRRIAAHIGVSHAAPAHHFKGLPELLGFVCGAGFLKLAQRIRETQETVKNEPYDRLIAMCNGYLSFARENQGLMSLMFTTSRERVDKEALGNAGQEAYSLLKAACAPFESIGTAPDSTETHIWSLVHGLAFLEMGGRFDNPGRVTANPDISDLLPILTLREDV